ncbi:MAG: hypothetical protein ACXVWF_02370 [Actinomycetota bacterium]
MALSPSGAGPRGWPFLNAWRSSRRDEVFVLERRRLDTDHWDSEGWFRSRKEATRAARDLARQHPAEEFRIRFAHPPA